MWVKFDSRITGEWGFLEV